ncbi:tautomerase family protein [Saccharibacillus sp. O16]|nr:tautomerase family protein [Saccharibacillus sp. O16]
MGQVKIYGIEELLHANKERLSEIIHSCMMDALELPAGKKFHRFFPMSREHFLFPEDRSEAYTIIEISMFAGRSAQSKKKLIELLFQRTFQRLGLSPNDLEITIFETPQSNWGIRGVCGDELNLNYRVEL